MPDLISHKLDGNVTEAIISNLPPYSAVTLKIAVLNGRYQGDFSSPVSFQSFFPSVSFYSLFTYLYSLDINIYA